MIDNGYGNTNIDNMVFDAWCFACTKKFSDYPHFESVPGRCGGRPTLVNSRLEPEYFVNMLYWSEKDRNNEIEIRKPHYDYFCFDLLIEAVLFKYKLIVVND